MIDDPVLKRLVAKLNSSAFFTDTVDSPPVSSTAKRKHDRVDALLRRIEAMSPEDRKIVEKSL